MSVEEKLVYGTAWKGDQTADLVYLALKAGFRAIATAAQPKHYREELVGEGIRRALSEGLVTREDIFVQTTFTPYPSQDPANLPYDPSAPLEGQVETSLANSLATLAATAAPSASASASASAPYLDALVLHVPYLNPQHTKQVWRAMSRAVRAGHVRQLGISNTTLEDLQHLVNWCCTEGRAPAAVDHGDTSDHVELVPPTIVQNRFYPGHQGDFDRAVRLYCCTGGSSIHHVGGRIKPQRQQQQGIITYQAFGFLRNKALVQDTASVGVVASVLGVSEPVALYALMIEALPPLDRGDIRVLDGTTKEERMKEDVTDIPKAMTALRRAKNDPRDELFHAIASFRIGFGEE